MSWDIGELRRDVSLAEVAAQYGLKLERDGHEFVACCPFHAEDTPSFTIFSGDDHVQRFHCFGCGERGDVVDFVEKIKGVGKSEAINILAGGKAPPNVKPVVIPSKNIYAGIKPLAPVGEIEVGGALRLYNPKRAGHEWEWGRFVPEMVFPYRRADGSLLGYVLRRSIKDGGKETPMVMFCRLTDGTETWCRFPFPKPRPLYRLDKLRDGQVIIVEGEKCADAMARGWGRRSVVSWAGGTYGINHADWSPLTGRSVVIWPDADTPGLKTADAIAARLLAIDCVVKILDVSGAAAA